MSPDGFFIGHCKVFLRPPDARVAIGPIRRGLICVAYVERVEDRIRLISARFATRRERRLFAEFMEGRLP